MNKELPKAPQAAGNYVTIKKIGDFIYTSGHVPISDDVKFIGKIPNDISIDAVSYTHLRAHETG